MIPSVIRTGMAIMLTGAFPCPALAADIQTNPDNGRKQQELKQNTGTPATISGRVSVIDGRRLWYPRRSVSVRLAAIDACELPQWAFDPKRHGENTVPKPIPCGPLAKAWLKRTIGGAQVTCAMLGYDSDDSLFGRCSVRGRDLALEMLRVGWAQVEATSPAPPEYRAWQRRAMSARHGMWATYVVDMEEWRAIAVDKTLSRRPIADFNLLAGRESEISPPFGDARRRPQRTDR